MWQVYAAVSAAILGVLGYLWYKLKVGAVAETDAQLRDAEIARQAETQKALESALAARAKEEAKELQDEASKILANPDLDAKRRAALELLAKLRGVH